MSSIVDFGIHLKIMVLLNDMHTVLGTFTLSLLLVCMCVRKSVYRVEESRSSLFFFLRNLLIALKIKKRKICDTMYNLKSSELNIMLTHEHKQLRAYCMSVTFFCTKLRRICKQDVKRDSTFIKQL